MAIGVYAKKKVYIGGYDRSGYVNQINMGWKNDLQDSTTVGDSTRIYTAGLNDIDFSVEGFYDPDSDDTVDKVMWDDIAGETEISWFSSAGTANTTGYGIPATITEYSPDLKIGSLRAFRISAKGYGKSVRITTLDGIVTKTSTGNGTARELGAVSSTQKVYSFIHVVSASGTSPTLNVTVASDDAGGFTTPTTRITHSQFSAVGSEVKSTSGAITDTYWRVTYTVGGTTPSFDVIVGVGIV